MATKVVVNQSLVINWREVYQSLGMEPVFSSLKTNEHSNFFDVYVLSGVTSNKVVKALRDLGVDVYLYTENLDRDITVNDRDPINGSYRIRFRRTIEADPELSEKSADDLEREKIRGITLLERLLLELGYFSATKDHLDKDNVTLCSGSRCSDGCVPDVYWYGHRHRVDILWGRSDRRRSDLRSRAVVP